MKFDTTYKPNHPTLLEDLAEVATYASIIEEAAERYHLQPCIIAAIGSRESRWGLLLQPKGPGGTGDGGWGCGLMQIDSRSHEFARGDKWQDPRENILYGAKVLADSQSIIFKWCTNGLGEPVVKGFDRANLLRYGLAAYNAGPLAVITCIRQCKDIDLCTTGRDYSADVLNRAGWFQGKEWA